MTTLKILPLILFLLSTTSKALEVRPQDLEFSSPIRCSENPTYRSLNLLHDIAILGADNGLTKKDVFRPTRLREVKRGGGFQATGALYCKEENLRIAPGGVIVKDGEWENGSAGIVRNKKGELRVLASAHQVINDFDTRDRNNKKEVRDNCYFITAEDMWSAIREEGGSPCGHVYLNRSKFISCMINKGLAYKISQNKQIMADYSEDLAILKFEGKAPKVKPLNIIEFDENMSLDKDIKGEFVKIKGQKYRVWLSSGNLGRTAKRSCHIFNKEQSSPLVSFSNYKNLVNSLRLTNCQSIKGFSGSPLILKQDNSDKLYTSCVFSSSITNGESFDARKSSNVCHSINKKALQLLEK